MDNVGCHKMDVLKEIFAEACVDVGFLPPNMTQFLQVLDLVVNGPLKAHIRHLRAQNLLAYFKSYKLLYNAELQKDENIRVMPKWSPPKPSVQECILKVMELLSEGGDLTTEKAKASITNTFISTGNIQDDNGEFVPFTYKPAGGTLEEAPTSTTSAFRVTQEDLDYTQVQPQQDGIMDAQFMDASLMGLIDAWFFDEEDVDLDLNYDEIDW